MKKKIYLKVTRSFPRIDLFLREKLGSTPRSRIEKMIEQGRVLLNQRAVGRKNQKLVAGDRIEVEWESPPETPPPSLVLNRLFEDEWLLAIDKPSGIAVHPGPGPRKETILDIFRHQYPQIEKMEEKERPGLVHRLDKDTSGILLLAKDENTMLKMQKRFKQRKVEKTYLALVSGRMRYRNGTIDAPIARSLRNRTKFEVPRDDPGGHARDARTDFSVVYEFPEFSLVRLHPHTGRTHQLRVHLAYFGNPVLGDRLYGKESGKKFFRLALHACSLSFAHPGSGNWISVRCPMPEPLRRFMAEQFYRSRLDRS